MSLLYKVFTLGLSAIQINIPGIVKSSISCHAILIACNKIFHLLSLGQIISLKFQTSTRITATSLRVIYKVCTKCMELINLLRVASLKKAKN